MNGTLPKQWFDKASEDLSVARLVFSEGYTAHTCFLAQQCIEKSLKGYLLAKSDRYPRTHRLIDLLNECRSLEPTFSQFLAACTIVDQYYVPVRYPDGTPGVKASGYPSQTEAQEAIDAAEAVLLFVTTQLP